MELVLFQNNTIVEAGFWSKFFEQFWPNFAIVFITAFISWRVYRQQQKEARIKNEVENYYLIYNFVLKNFEEFHTIWDQNSKSVLNEIHSFLNNLEQIKHLIGCYYGIEELKLLIEVPDKQKYAIEEINKIQPKLILKQTFFIIFNSLIEKDFQQESNIFTMNGDVYFQKILLSFQQDCLQANKNLAKINDDIEKTSSHTHFKERIILSPDKNYEENIAQIEQTKQELLYFRTLYDTLLHISETGLYKAIYLFDHLNAFNEHYSKKYSHILKTLNINISKYQTQDLFVKIEDLKTIDENYKNIHAPEWEVPLYRHLRRNWLDTIEGLIYPVSYKTFWNKFKKKD